MFPTVLSQTFATEKGPERVRIAVSSKSLGFLDVWAAREKGFFRKHGLDAEVIAMRPPRAIAALQAEEIDYSFGASTALRASISGLPVKLVSLGLRSTFHTLVAKPNIKSIPDLKGKIIAVTIGAADDVACRYLLRRGGREPRPAVVFFSLAGCHRRPSTLFVSRS